MKRMLFGLALALCSSAVGAQAALDEDCVQTSDGLVCDPFDPAGAVQMQDGIIGVFLPGQDSPWLQLLNPNNPRALPPNPIHPTDPYRPVILTQPGR